MKLLLSIALVSLLAATSAQEAFDWEPLGEETYGTCAGCHGSEGEGVPGVFPPHAGHLPTLVATEEGRTYLTNVMLYGLSGEIEVLGESYTGAMPAWSSLSDEQIAAVLNHSLSAWGNAELLPGDFALYTPEDIAAERGKELSAADVQELRTALTSE